MNTAGGVVAGDRLDVGIDVGPRTAVTLTSAAAEKVYRSQGAVAEITNRLAAALDPMRAAIEDACRDGSSEGVGAEGGASCKDGIIVARLVARAGEPLRRAVAAVLGSVDGLAVPRVWQ